MAEPETPTTNYYISAGDTNSPYYYFYDNPEGNNALTTLTLNKDETYVFSRLGDATSHAFFLSDQSGWRATSTSAINIQSTAIPTDGITGSQTITLSFNSNFTTPGNIYWYCTVHSSMIGNFSVVD